MKLIGLSVSGITKCGAVFNPEIDIKRNFLKLQVLVNYILSVMLNLPL